MNERTPIGFLLPLRLLMGAILIVEGYGKLSSGWMSGDALAGVLGEWMAKGRTYDAFVPVVELARAHTKLFGTLVTIGELAIGSAFLLGIFTRPAAFFGMILLASIALAGGQKLSPPGSALIMAAVCLTFLFTAPGRFLGFDQILRGKFPRWLV